MFRRFILVSGMVTALLSKSLFAQPDSCYLVTINGDTLRGRITHVLTTFAVHAEGKAPVKMHERFVASVKVTAKQCSRNGFKAWAGKPVNPVPYPYKLVSLSGDTVIGDDYFRLSGSLLMRKWGKTIYEAKFPDIRYLMQYAHADSSGGAGYRYLLGREGVLVPRPDGPVVWMQGDSIEILGIQEKEPTEMTGNFIAPTRYQDRYKLYYYLEGEPMGYIGSAGAWALIRRYFVNDCEPFLLVLSGYQGDMESLFDNVAADFSRLCLKTSFSKE